MATKWKNSLLVVVWVVLFTFGLSGILSALSYNEYLYRDYFKSAQFTDRLYQFIDYLNIYELNYIPPEQAKEKIVVTQEEINEHRYRYGDLAEQVSDIEAQYADKIQQAQLANNSELAEYYIAERDEKIADITNNFKSDEHVRAKIVKEKEEEIDRYYREIEQQRAEFNELKASFKYYLRDTATGVVCTNLHAANLAEANKLLQHDKILFLRNYSHKDGIIKLSQPLIDNGLLLADQSLPAFKKFEGKIAIPKTAPAASAIVAEYDHFQQKQRMYFAYLGGCIVAFLLSLYLYKRSLKPQQIIPEGWQALYQRLPIDVRLCGLIIIGFITLGAVANIYSPYAHDGYLPRYFFIRRTIFNLIGASFLVAITFLQAKWLWPEVKDWDNLKATWQQGGFIAKAYRGIKNAFLIRSIGFQVLFLLALVFAFGAGAVVVLLEPNVILIYGPLSILVGIPILVIIIRSAGRFNQIVLNTNELVQGNLGPDLPAEGRSPLAVLAGNINKLKHGVKASLREQAKSERLKTELITNVSHDLRTPLTSIISYTELLKTPDLAPEDREAYIEIIDRKSKRLKVLIDDLFEASKMASGNVELLKEQVDIGQLLQQALAEYDEAIGKTSLQFRVTKPDHKLYAIVDGQKIWRVFDNLIGNILKYALENTRVYISIQDLPDKIIITFKNISKYELGSDGDELFERFKRGDTSRHTEGSGLGLAIAKSIIDLHGGSMDIDLDGDLFKVTVTLIK